MQCHLQNVKYHLLTCWINNVFLFANTQVASVCFHHTISLKEDIKVARPGMQTGIASGEKYFQFHVCKYRMQKTFTFQIFF